jgi:mono/diheme cytochrome c family protein
VGIRDLMALPLSSARAGHAVAAGPRLLQLLGLLLLAACQTVPPAGSAPSAAPSPGQAFARARCSGCHETGLYGTSSNPNAPPFGAIANQEGVTVETLSDWLRSAHNYPIEMDFFLNQNDVDALVAYFLSLKVPHYRRPADL